MRTFTLLINPLVFSIEPSIYTSYLGDHALIGIPFLSPLQRPPAPRIYTAHVLLHHIPIYPLPPRLQELPLPSHPVVPQPHMLPRVHPQQHLQILPSGRQLLVRPRIRAHHARGALQVHRVRLRGRPAGDVGGRGGHVVGLQPEVRARVRGAGDVGG